MFPAGGYRARVDEAPRDPESGVPGRPGLLLWLVVGAVVVEALVLVGVAAVFVFALGTGRELDTRASVATAVFALSFAVLLGAAARGLLLGRRWARAPVITVQLLVLLALAGPLIGAGTVVPGLGLALLAVVAGAGLFAPSVMAHTRAADSPPML